MANPEVIIEARNLGKSFRQGGLVVQALDGVSFAVEAGSITALVGPDGAGKTTLLRLLAGLMRADAGELFFAGQDWERCQGTLHTVMGYMPQKFGLYEDLTVQENLDLYADLRGLDLALRKARYASLLSMAGLERFRARLAGRLSGGMKQKLGLVCTLVQPPKLLLLDEPTVGVDPLSRRELWQMIATMQKEMGMAVVVSTAYLDEAALCDTVVLLFGGRSLASGTPESLRLLSQGLCHTALPQEGEKARQLQARLLGAEGIIDAVPRNGAVRVVAEAAVCHSLPRMLDVPSTLEDSFMLLLHQEAAPSGVAPEEVTPRGIATGEVATGGVASEGPSALPAGGSLPPEGAGNGGAKSARDGLMAGPVIEAKNVSRMFGDFIAVNNVSFSVNRGEIFGLLGPNGAGKTTTFKMLCGLLPASRGSLRVAGVDVGEARKEARRHIGYVAQKFSLYGALSALENIRFFAGAYGLRGREMHERIAVVAREFGLEDCIGQTAGSLPGGYKQRLAMAVALLHRPQILFLDEPTSGADPQARRQFWQRISRLADSGVTIVVTTHFMEDAEYCDRILIQDSGTMLALGTPESIRAQAAHNLPAVTSMDDAFVGIVQKARAEESRQAEVQA